MNRDIIVCDCIWHLLKLGNIISVNQLELQY